MKMTESEKLEAFLKAEKLMASRVIDSEVSRQLQKQFKITAKIANNIIKSVVKQWMDDYEDQREQFKTRQLAVLYEISRICFKKEKYDSAIKVEGLIAKITGTLEPVNAVVSGSEDFMAALEKRTEEEHLFYAENGFWPEDVSSNGQTVN